jgi:hypothetical protein
MKSIFALAATAMLALGAIATPLETRANPGKKGSSFNDVAAVKPLGAA